MGAPFRTKIDGQIVQLPATEMAGEMEWRIDVLRWLVRRVFFHLVSLQPAARETRLQTVEWELVVDFNLHALEAQGVIEGATHSIQSLSDEEVARLNKARRLFESQLTDEWKDLAKRYWSIVREEAVDVS